MKVTNQICDKYFTLLLTRLTFIIESYTCLAFLTSLAHEDNCGQEECECTNKHLSKLHLETNLITFKYQIFQKFKYSYSLKMKTLGATTFVIALVGLLACFRLRYWIWAAFQNTVALVNLG